LLFIKVNKTAIFVISAHARFISAMPILLLACGFTCYGPSAFYLAVVGDTHASALIFVINDAQLKASSSCASPNSFFIGSHGQELSVPRNTTLTGMPILTEIGSPSWSSCGYDSKSS
jgi:hypothetical protein